DVAMGWKLLRNPSRMRILTIDGLCSQYLARDPGAAGVGAGMAVQEEATPLYLESIERLFDHLGSIPEEGDDWSAARQALTDVLVHLDGNAQQLSELLLRKLATRDQWMQRLGSDADSLAEVLQARQQFELEGFLQGLQADRYAQAGKLVRKLGCSVNKPDHAAARYAAACNAQDSGVEAEILRAWYFSRVFLTGKNLRSPKFNKGTFPGMAETLRPAMEQLREIYAGWMEQPDAQAALLRMGNAPPLELDGNARELQQHIVTVLQYALAELRVLFAERAQCDFHHVTEMALQSLGDESEPGALLLAEDLRLEHILMDEFQDTSNTQFELLRRLVSGWSGPPGNNPGRSLFLVGDPMQSIYRFREANVGLFIDVVQQGGLGEVKLEYLQLQANFRSGASLVNWINPQFRQIFPASDKSDAGAVHYAPAEAAAGEGGLVALHPFDADASHRDEAEYVLQLIGQSRAELGDPSIAILTRTRSHLADIAALLQQRGLEYEAVKVGLLQSRPVIQDLLSLTRALCHPADRPAWLALLRAPWCALNVAELHQLAGSNPDSNLLQRILEADGLADSASAVRVARLGQVMQRAIQNRANQSLRNRVEQAWRALGGEFCYASPAESENSAVYFRLLESLETESNEQLVERLQSRMDKLYATSSSSRLQLMPIHQAKGLEFDVVIIPGMQRLPKRGDESLVELQEFRLADGRNATLMAPIPSRNKPEASLYQYLQAIDRE
ncbi:MAG TPA: 3'-5' exonuclease, partial [Xanthomonadales bacterium]|nr:3'-5' exonuclease [Xanthomonadales bacterium]